MTTVQERRQAKLTANLNRALDNRVKLIRALTRNEERISDMQRALRRYERLAARPALPVTTPQQAAALAEAIAPLIGEQDDDLELPSWLDRKREGDRKDAEARATLEADQAERKRAKAAARTAKKKLDLKAMPLTGKAALDAIRGE